MSRKSWFGTTDGEDKSENENKAQYDFDRNNRRQAHTVGLNRNGRNMKYSMESLNTLNRKASSFRASTLKYLHKIYFWSYVD